VPEVRDDTAPAQGGPPGATAPTRFEQLAKVVLLLALAVVALAALVVLPNMVDQAPGRLGVAVIAVILTASLPALALFGLFARMPWRRPVAGTALWFLVISGILEFVVQVGSGSVSIPFLAIAAGFVLTDRAPRRMPGHVAVRAVAVLLGLAAVAWYLVGLGLAGTV